MRRTFAALALAASICVEPAAAEMRDIVIEATARDLIGAEADAYGAIIGPDAQETWDASMPPAAETPPGLVVFISAGDTGAVPRSWRRVLEQRNLVWIAARASGNAHANARRVLLAVLAVEAAKRETAIDASRIYLAGFSGGGRVSSIAAATLPARFRGAMLICGADWHQPETPALRDRVRANRYVFVTGGGDFNRASTRDVYRRYRHEGVDNALLLDLPRLGHVMPEGDTFDAAIGYLDATE